MTRSRTASPSAFLASATNPHHYQLGAISPVPGLSEAVVDAVVGYVRWMQRTAGLR